MNERIDVLAVMDGSWRVFASQSIRSGDGADFQADAVKEARAAVAELIAAAKLVNADHSAPHDCYATGQLTGDAYLDLVRCPGCQLAAALARVGAP